MSAANTRLELGAVDAVGVDEADLRRSRQVVLEPRDVEDRMVHARRRRRRDRRPPRAGRRCRCRPLLPVSLTARYGRDDPPRVDQVVRRVEQLGAVEKERTLLREEQRAARIERELAGVGLDLREVRVDRAVQRQVRRHAPAHVAAELRPAGVVAPAVAGRRAVGVRRRDRIEIEHQAAAQVGEAVERARLREERALGAQRRRPAVLVAAALHAAQDVERPRLHAVGGEAQRLERDRDLDLVAVVGQPPLRLEDVVGREVGDLASALERAEQRRRRGCRCLRPARRRPGCRAG